MHSRQAIRASTVRRPSAASVDTIFMPLRDSDSRFRRFLRRVFNPSHSAESSSPPLQRARTISNPVSLGHRPRTRRGNHGYMEPDLGVYGRRSQSRSAHDQTLHNRSAELMQMSRSRSQNGYRPNLNLSEFAQKVEREAWHSSPGAQANRTLEMHRRQRERMGRMGSMAVPVEVQPPPGGIYVPSRSRPAQMSHFVGV
ncbi:hypothetical protein BDV93DRAFT_523226 [Ceratobasidium sp. AG-I]|nr:hypothetical protein BDV93DRAFT_523226 [Ceratobasidium sp. AG-I]